MGWVALDRLKIQEHYLYFKNKFSPFQAFFDMLILANHTDSSFQKRGITINVKRGQLARSQVELADRWGWNWRTVKKFILELKKHNEVQSKSYPDKSPVTTIITILRYDHYVKEFAQSTQKSAEQNTEQSAEQNTHIQQCLTISNNVQQDEMSNGKRINSLRAPQKNKSKNQKKIKPEEKELVQDILTWAYNPENNFMIDKAFEETAEFLENTIRRYGFDEIQAIFDYCSTERYPWDKGLEEREGENVSAYSEFWHQIRGLK